MLRSSHVSPNSILYAALLGLLAVLAVASGTIFSQTWSWGLFLLAFALGALWGFVWIFCIDKILHWLMYRNATALFWTRALTLTLGFTLLQVDLACFYLLGEHLQIFYLEALLRESFLKHSALPQQFYTWLSMSVGVSVLGWFSLIWIIERKTTGKTVKVPALLWLLFVILILERGITAFGAAEGSAGMRVCDRAIVWRRHSSSSWFQSLYYKIAPTPLPPSLEIPASPGAQPLPPVVFVMAESLRADMIRPDIMPNLTHEAGRVYSNHYSTSNCTHFGLFSVLFGLFPSMYGDAIKQPANPVLFQVLKKLGYKTHVITSASFDWMDLERFIGPATVDDFQAFEKTSLDWIAHDQKVVDEFQKSFRKDSPPSFHLLVLNSTHHDYYFPVKPPFAPFKPYAKVGFNFQYWWGLRTEADQLRNRYKNAAHYVDTLLDQIIGHIKNEGAWDQTLLAFFGDHGEEIFEEGHYTHASALNQYQTSAALFLHGPGNKEPGRVNATTSHLDLLPTLLAELKRHGVELQTPNWMTGMDLLNPSHALSSDRVVFSASAAQDNPSCFAFHCEELVFRPKRWSMSEAENRIFQKGLSDFQRIARILAE